MARGADIQRMVGDLGRLGSVVSVDHAAGTCRVQLGDIVSGDLPWLERAAGATRTWCPPSVGEQVFVFSPEADLACGFVAGSMFSDANPAPGNDAGPLITFADGATVAYDADAHSLTARLPSGSFVEIEADDIYLRGNLHVTGYVDVKGDVIGAGVSLKDHRHDKVQAGGALSGKPVA